MYRHRGLPSLALMALLVVAAQTAHAGVPPAAAALENALTQVTEKIMPVVVNVTSETRMPTRDDQRGQWEEWLKRSPFGDRFPFPAPPPRRRGPGVSLGTGIIIQADGYVLTNEHVVHDADKVKVLFGADKDDPEEYEGTVVGSDSESDLAVVKIDRDNLPVAVFANSDDVKIGSFALAIGSPFRFHQSVSLGIVSAKGRHLETPGGFRSFQDYIQTDASINQGNSGGPLVNLRGEVIGINSIIYSPTGGNVGLGFAVPSNTVKKMLPYLLAGKKISRGYLGVEFRALTRELADFYGIDGGFEVSKVIPGGPSDKAGVKIGDVIISLDGKKPRDSEDFRRRVGELGANQTVPMTVFREGKEVPLKVTLGERPNGGKETPAQPAKVEKLLGLSVRELTDDDRKQLELEEEATGLLITNVEADSDAERADPAVRPGTVVVGVDRKGAGRTTIADMGDYRTALGQFKPGDEFVLLVLAPQGRLQRHVVKVRGEDE